MHNLHLLVVDDEHAETISQQLEDQLGKWPWVQSGLVSVKKPPRPLSSLQAWQSQIDDLRNQAAPCTFFTTIDLEIPEHDDGARSIRFGEAIIRECRGESRLRHLVITKHADAEVAAHLRKRYCGLHIFLNDPTRPIPPQILDEIYSAVRDDILWLALDEEQEEMYDVIHFGGSEKLKEAFWKAEQLVSKTNQTPIVIVADAGSWGFHFVRLLGKLRSREQRSVSLSPVRLNRDNVREFRQSLKTWRDRGYYKQEDEIIYLTGLEEWNSTLTEATSSELFRELTDLVRRLWGGDASVGRGASTLAVRFPTIEPSQFYLSINPQAADFYNALCEPMVSGDLSRSQRDYRTGLPGFVVFPSLEAELRPEFVSRVVEDELRRRRLQKSSEDLDYSPPVRRFLRLHRWAEDKKSPGVRGLEKVLDGAFAKLSIDAGEPVLRADHIPVYEKSICHYYDLVGEIHDTYAWLKDVADNGCDKQPGRRECLACIKTDFNCHLETIFRIRERTKAAVARARNAEVDLRDDREIAQHLKVLRRIDGFLDELFPDQHLADLKAYVADSKEGVSGRRYPSPERASYNITFDWPVSNMQLHQCIAHYLEHSHRTLVLSTEAFNFIRQTPSFYKRYYELMQEAQRFAEIEEQACRSYPTPVAEAVDLVRRTSKGQTEEAVVTRGSAIAKALDILLRYVTTLGIAEYVSRPREQRPAADTLSHLKKRIDYKDWHNWFGLLSSSAGAVHNFGRAKKGGSDFVTITTEKLQALVQDSEVPYVPDRNRIDIFEAHRRYRNKYSKWNAPKIDASFNEAVWLAFLELLQSVALKGFELLYILGKETSDERRPEAAKYRTRVLAGLGGFIEEQITTSRDLDSDAIYVRRKEKPGEMWRFPPHMIWDEHEKECCFLMGIYGPEADSRGRGESILGEANDHAGKASVQYFSFWRDNWKRGKLDDIDKFIAEIRGSGKDEPKGE